MVFDLDAEKINPLMELSPPDCAPTLLSSRLKAPSVFAFNVRKTRLTLPEISGNPAPLCAPATKLSSGVQFRKDCWLPQKPNSSRWLRKGQRFFRNWVLGTEAAGATNQPGLPEISGSFAVRGTMINDNSVLETTGAFLYTNTSYDERFASFQVSSNLSSQGCTFNAARNNRIYGASPTVMPASVNLPAILYLGRPS